MDYAEARAYLAEAAKGGSVLGLEPIRELLHRLGDPQDGLRFVHIAGTNGKGSVLALLSTMLTGAGYRTGRYLSPTLFSYRERIQVDGVNIEREALARHMTAIAAAAEQMANRPTVFEMETALAFLYFQERQCDIVVLETGLGGALDATNIIRTPVLEVLTSISMDHMEVLGNTLEEITRQKAGIIKPHTRVVSAAQPPEAERVLAEVCRERDCVCRTVDPERITGVRYGCVSQTFSYKDWEAVELRLAGSYQIANGALALEAAEALREAGFCLSDRQIRQGMRDAVWRGRFTLLRQEPAVVMDGAHNPAAARELQRSLELYFPGRKLYYVFGMFRDKDYSSVIALTAPLAERIITVETPGNPRALPAEALRDAVAKVHPAVEAAESVAAAVDKALAMAGKEDVIVIFGSLSFLGEAEQAVQRGEKDHG